MAEEQMQRAEERVEQLRHLTTTGAGGVAGGAGPTRWRKWPGSLALRPIGCVPGRTAAPRSGPSRHAVVAPRSWMRRRAPS